jgi:hypothetical protein
MCELRNPTRRTNKWSFGGTSSLGKLKLVLIVEVRMD